MSTYNQFLAAVLLAAACQCRADDQIRTYNVPKDHPPIPASMTGAPDLAVNSAPIHWITPKGWQEIAASSMRLASFIIAGEKGGKAEVAVTSFPGQVGTEVDNVNRWRRELNLPAIQENGISAQPVSVDSEEGKLFEIAGATQKTVVAMVPHNGATFFFKLKGDAATVGTAQPAFKEFLQSVRFVAPVEAVSAPNPHGEMMPTAADASAGAGGDTAPKWSVPANWTEQQPGPMIFKSFSVTDNNAKASVTVSFFPGTVGGVLANVNRWRGQLGLTPVQEDQLSTATQALDVADGHATLVDFTGKSRAGDPARLVAAIVPHGDNTWFYKLNGNPATVGTEKDAFVGFVKTVHYP